MSANPNHLAVPKLAWLIIPIAWLIARPYRGIRHDGILYMGQALRHIWPDIFARDLFFAHGSQDSFSVVGASLARMFEVIGVAPVEALVPLLAHAVLLLTALWLVQIDASFKRFEAWLALLALAAFPHLYDGASIFAFAEPFLTARTVSEPLCLLGLCLLVTRQWVGCAVVMACAALVHPLMAIPVVVVAWVYLSLGDRRWWWAAAFALVPLCLGLAGLSPFDTLFARYDALWWSSVEVNNPVVVLTSWDAFGWQGMAFDLFLLALAQNRIPGRLGRLCRATVLSAALLVVISVTGADLFHNIMLTSLQLWRVLWWAHLLALLMLPVIALRIAQQKPHGLMAASALFLAAAATRWTGGWALAAWAALAIGIRWRNYPVSRGVGLAAVGASVLAAVVISTMIGLQGAQVALRMEGATTVSVLLAFVTSPIAIFTGALLLLWALGRPVRYRPISWVALAVLAGAAVIHWDRREDWQRFVESSLHEAHPFQMLIGEHQQVYWHDQPLATWLVLKRPSYYSEPQAAGQLFNRGTMEVLVRRDTQFRVLRMQEQLCGTMADLSGAEVDASCSPTLDLAEEICVKQPELDFMVFDLKLSRGVVDQWTFKPPSGHKPKTFYLYDCNRFRST